MGKTVKIAELEKNFSELMAEARAGEDIFISEDGAPVARLVPVSAEDDGAELARLIRQERASRKAVSLEEILQWRDEGRK